MNFTSFKNWLFEQKKIESKIAEFGCVMLYSDISDWDKRLKMIKKEDIYDDEFNDYGLEKESHVTLLWGIHLSETDPQDIINFMKTFKPIKVEIRNIGIFENKDYDVVKYNIPVTYELKKYHELLKSKFPNTQTFDSYRPHMTISYVKKGTSDKYKKQVNPFNVMFDKIVYSFKKNKSDKENTKIKIKLKQ
jgi:2'-5' RNA ligase